MGIIPPPARGFRVRLGSLFLACLPPSAAAQAADYSAWAHHRDFYYDASPKGADLAEDVHGFPVLIRLAKTDFPFAEARDSGQDLRFAKADGTPISFEIDRYDPAAGKAEIWLRADTLKAGLHGHLARMYWGNPAAGRPSQAPVFRRNDGFAAVWHLRGKFPVPRGNSVAAGEDAVPQNYDNDEEAEGVIGHADSLDGASAGDHLQTWEGFEDFSGGFTFSAWAYHATTATTAASAALFDFGNGPGRDNLVLARAGTTADLVFESHHGAAGSRVTAQGAISPDAWQHFAVTVAGKAVKIYRNGALAASGELGDTIASMRRGLNYLGRSHRPASAFFAGKLDEVQVSRTARGAAWIRLAYASQKPGQVLVTPVAPVVCHPRFEVSADTAVPEGGTMVLSGKADCAESYQWSVEAGPDQRILDPYVPELRLPAPRVAGDTVTVFRFSAEYGDSTVSGTVTVAIEEAIPEPRFTLPARLSWNGRDARLLEPKLENLPAIRASPRPDLHATWTLAGISADTALSPEGLLLKSTEERGVLEVRLCMHNHGPEVCRETEVAVEAPTGLAVPGPRRESRSGAADAYAADGRRAKASGGIRFRRPSAAMER